MSHELRTPLTTILALAEMLTTELRGALNAHQRKYVTNIDRSGRHLLSLINDILDLSKVEAGKLELQIKLLTVDEVCQTSLRMIKEIAAQKELNVTYHINDASLVMLADETRLKQMLVNLLSNAVKFTASGGSVELIVEAHAADKLVRFAVQDTGIGILVADAERIFQPFTQLDSGLTRQHEGAGLGLTLVKRLAVLHGGGISIASEGVEGKGSRFTITLPWRTVEESLLQPAGATFADSDPARTSALSAAVATPEAAATGQTVTLRRPLVLLVDDNEINMQMLFDYLHNLGYQLTAARTGGEALQQAQVSMPDIILMDIHMPAMDGLEAIRRLRMLPGLAATPIIALTAFPRAEDRARCLEAGADDFMSKPLSLRELAERMEQLLFRYPSPHV